MKPWTVDDPVFVLHRYYLQAIMTRKLFERMMEQYPGPHTSITEGFLNLQTAMGLWYGAVYAVAEGWRDYVKPTDPKVDALIADPKIDKLKRYRNAVFHYQREYFSHKMLEAMHDDFAQWVTLLYRELGRFFLEYMDKKKVELESKT